eukprot:6530056-Alexandrium_andersonii.AAC.1
MAAARLASAPSLALAAPSTRPAAGGAVCASARDASARKAGPHDRGWRRRDGGPGRSPGGLLCP